MSQKNEKGYTKKQNFSENILSHGQLQVNSGFCLTKMKRTAKNASFLQSLRLSQRRYRRDSVGLSEYGGSCDEHIGSRCGTYGCIIGSDSAVYLN